MIFTKYCASLAVLGFTLCLAFILDQRIRRRPLVRKILNVGMPICICLVFFFTVDDYVRNAGTGHSIHLWLTSLAIYVAGVLLAAGPCYLWPKTWWPRKRDRVSRYVEDPDNPPSWKGLAEGD